MSRWFNRELKRKTDRDNKELVVTATSRDILPRVKSALHYHPLNHTRNVFGTVVTPDSDVFGLISSRLLA